MCEYDNDQFEEEVIHNKLPYFNRNVVLLISILINKPSLSKYARPFLDLIKFNKNFYVKFFIYLVKKCYKHKEITTNESLLQYFKNTKYIVLINKISKSDNVVGKPVLKDVFIDIIYHIYYHQLKDEKNQIMSLNKHQELSYENKIKVWTLLQQMHTIKTRNS